MTLGNTRSFHSMERKNKNLLSSSFDLCVVGNVFPREPQGFSVSSREKLKALDLGLGARMDGTSCPGSPRPMTPATSKPGPYSLLQLSTFCRVICADAPTGLLIVPRGSLVTPRKTLITAQGYLSASAWKTRQLLSLYVDVRDSPWRYRNHTCPSMRYALRVPVAGLSINTSGPPRKGVM